MAEIVSTVEVSGLVIVSIVAVLSSAVEVVVVMDSVIDSVVEVIASLVVEDSKTLNVVDGTMMVLLPRMMLQVNEAGEVMVKSREDWGLHGEAVVKERERRERTAALARMLNEYILRTWIVAKVWRKW